LLLSQPDWLSLGPPHPTPGAQKPSFGSASGPSNAVEEHGPHLVTAVPGWTPERTAMPDDHWLGGTCCCNLLPLLALLRGCRTAAVSGLVLLLPSS